MKKLSGNSAIIIFAGIMMSLFSCKKYIYDTPKDATYDAVYWNSQQNVEEAMAGAYGNLRSSFESASGGSAACYFIWGDLTTNELITNPGVAWNLQSLTPDQSYYFNYVPYYETSLEDWSRFYQVINQCNLILTKAPQMPLSDFGGDSAVRNQYLGEALFLRAFTYFYMSRVWGDVVVYNEIVKNPNDVRPLARTADTAVVNFCINDLKQAKKYLLYAPNSQYGPVRANKGAVLACLAHAYAWQHDYTDAAAVCNDIIQNGGYTLEGGANYSNIWSGGDQESIFELNMLYNSGANEAGGDFFGEFLEYPVISGAYGQSAYLKVNPAYLFNLFDTTNDVRYKDCFVKSGFGDEILTKYANIKYKSATDSTQGFFVNNNLVIFRLSDIILLRAEALTKLGDPGDAIPLVNIIRERAGVKDYDATQDGDLYQFISDERGRELYGEGWRFFDLVRSGLLSNEVDGYSSARVSNKGYYWPISLRNLKQQDPLLTQTPWWATH